MPKKVNNFYISPIFGFIAFTQIWSVFIWLIILPSFNISATNTDWFWLGELAPGLAALTITCYFEGGGGVWKLIRTISYWRCSPFCYYFVLVILPFFYLAAIGYSALEGDKVTPLITLYNSMGYFGIFGFKFYGIAMIPVLTVLYCFCEEIGWRGFLLNRLLLHYDIFYSSIIVGISMAIFHIAIMNLNTFVEHPFLFVIYLIFSIMDSFIFSWLYIKSNRSLLIVSLCHALTDIYGAFCPNILSPLGQGEKGSVVFLRFLFFLPVFIALYKSRKSS